MNCKQAKGKLALLIGNDLDGSGVEDVQQHLAQCSACRQHLQRLSSCLEALQVPAAHGPHGDGESLWPQISMRLASPTFGQKPHRLSGWGPTLAVAASCLAMFWVASYQFSSDSSVPSYSVPGQRIPMQEVDGPPAGAPIFHGQPRPEQQDRDSSRIRDRESGRLQMRNGNSPSIQLTPVSEQP